MSGVAFTYHDAKRIAGAVQWAEGQKGLIGGGVDHNPLRPGESWVRTPASLPGGYDGTTALEGVGLLRLADGTDHDLNTVWVKDPNDAPLAADTVYRGTFNGTLSQAGSNYPLFLVQAGSVAAAGLTMGWYAGGSIYGSGGLGIRKTDITLQNGSTLRILGHPWGQDAPAAYATMGGYDWLHWQVILEDTETDTANYHLIPFIIPAIVRFSHSNGTPVVECRANPTSGAFTFWAWDTARLVPNTGVYRAHLTLWNAIEFTRVIGFNVVSVNLANPISVSSGVTLSGTGGSSAFPAGMGATYGAPGATVSGVE